MIGIRRALIPVALAAAVSFGGHKQTACCVDVAPKQWPFDNKGLPTKLSSFGSPVILVGAGMRRKNLYIVEVDVYLVGLSLSEKAIISAQEWTKCKGEEESVLSSFVLKPSKNPSSNPTMILTIRMVRSVTYQQFIDAFREAFVGIPTEDFDDLKNLMATAGSDSYKAGDEINFLWLENGEVGFTKNGVVTGKVKNDVVSKRLLDIYTDPRRAVSKELYNSIENNIQTMGELVRSKDPLLTM